MKKAFWTIYIRFGFFFILGAIAGGVLVPYNNKALVAAFPATPRMVARQKWTKQGTPIYWAC